MAARNEEEATSDFASETISSFTTIHTARLVYEYQNGRRYQGLLQDRYGMPNDEAEQLREGIKHKLYADYILEGKPFLAPVRNPQKIIDLGTGAGYWALDVAEKFPSARVIGVDISPIQPRWTPPNAEFRVEDLDDEREWSRIHNGADLVHARAFLQTIRHPRSVLERSLAVLKPGGWFECHDLTCEISSQDGTVRDDYPLFKLYNLVDGPFSEAYGWNLYIATKVPEMLRQLGYTNVCVRRNVIPMGRWHTDARMREMGIFNQIIHTEWMRNMLHKPDAMGISADEAAVLGQDIMDSFNDSDVHASMVWMDCWAQKPG